MSECEHQYQHQGEVTWPSEYPRPGSGAHDRNYATAYFCARCCALKLTNERRFGNTYEPARFGAVEYKGKPT